MFEIYRAKPTLKAQAAEINIYLNYQFLVIVHLNRYVALNYEDKTKMKEAESKKHFETRRRLQLV